MNEVKSQTLANAYNGLLVGFLYGINKREIKSLPCEAYNTRRYSKRATFTVGEPLSEPMISLCGIHDPHILQQYVMEMVDGILDFEIAKGNWKYTYHDRMVSPVNQIDAVINELKQDLYSRRAVISIRTPDDIGSSDPACMQHIQFLYDGTALNMYVLFRSNDLAKATFMNAYALIRLGEKICKEVGVLMGTYTHTANDLHVYGQDIIMIEKYVERIKKNPESCVADYTGNWDELMNDEIESIEAMVKELSNKKKL